VCRPVFRVTVSSVNPKHQNKAIALQMHTRPSFTNCTIVKRPISSCMRIDQSIGFQPREPLPAVSTDGFEIGKSAVPAIERDIARFKAACLSSIEHSTKVRVLGQTI